MSTHLEHIRGAAAEGGRCQSLAFREAYFFVITSDLYSTQYILPCSCECVHRIGKQSKVEMRRNKHIELSGWLYECLFVRRILLVL